MPSAPLMFCDLSQCLSDWVWTSNSPRGLQHVHAPHTVTEAELHILCLFDSKSDFTPLPHSRARF